MSAQDEFASPPAYPRWVRGEGATETVFFPGVTRMLSVTVPRTPRRPIAPDQLIPARGTAQQRRITTLRRMQKYRKQLRAWEADAALMRFEAELEVERA